MADDKFFFEEDPDAKGDSGITWSEHTTTFLSVLETEGVLRERKEISLDPMMPQSEMQTQHLKTTLLDIEYGIVKDDYVLHVTPLHPRKNLTNTNLLSEAMRAMIVLLNAEVPTTLRVEIFKPRADWEIKATSFIIKEGATAWNLDRGKIESVIIPKIMEQVSAICMKA